MKKELKMWLVVREDLDMSPGKLAVQSGHAFMMITDKCKAPNLRKLYADYVSFSNAMPKIVVKVSSEKDLLKVVDTAKENDIPWCLVTDAGRTEFGKPTNTVVVFGPAYREDLPKYLKSLRMMAKVQEIEGLDLPIEKTHIAGPAVDAHNNRKEEGTFIDYEELIFKHKANTHIVHKAVLSRTLTIEERAYLDRLFEKVPGLKEAFEKDVERMKNG